MELKNTRKIHCIGIGGIGVSALARLFESQGKQVSGYDDNESAVPYGSSASDVEAELPDLVVYSDAVPEDHPQRVLARQRGIPEMSYAQALGQVSRDYKTIVIAGTHGKSTTTAMLGLIFESAGMDPLVIVGTKVPQWPLGNLRLPVNAECRMQNAEWLVVEGDDYRDHFLELHPYAVVVTTIEYDHPDFFKDLDDTVESFKELIEKVSEQGIVVLNKNDKGCEQLRARLSWSANRAIRRPTMYGKDERLWEELLLQVPGEFNKYNALAAATCARELGVADEVIKKALSEFKGVWRRFEIVGEWSNVNGQMSNVTIISDYGHHPTAIRETMKAAREAYPNRRLVLVYQPHQHSRTKKLFNDFVEVLKNAADVVIVSEIYTVKGRMEDKEVSSRQLVGEIAKSRDCESENIIYGGDLEETKRVVLEKVKPNDVIIFMGAGDIDTIARKLCENRDRNST